MAKKKTTRTSSSKKAPKKAASKKPAAKKPAAKKAPKKVAKKASKKVSKKATKKAGGGRAAASTKSHAAHGPRSGSRHAPKKAAKPTGAKALELFAQAMDMAQSGFLFDAISAFKDLAADRKNDLADDAQCNVGLCYLRMHLYADALDAFAKVARDYPDATIAQVQGAAHEFGKTAAKAHLGRVHAFLGMGDVASARAEAEAMQADTESHVVSADGSRQTFAQLADSAVRAAGG
ncbi:MAG: hypothetical protein R3B68_11615 [Phycisphaerales bacterium]